MKIYVASSWRNDRYPDVIRCLREAGHKVYDFRRPRMAGPGTANTAFNWSDIDPNWQTWTPQQFREALKHPVARAGFDSDLAAMTWADAFVLVTPCGWSAHLELGWAVGNGKPAFILLSRERPELMYSLATGLCMTIGEVVSSLKAWEGDYAEDQRNARRDRREHEGEGRTRRVSSRIWLEHEGWGRPAIAIEAHYFHGGNPDSICEWWFGYEGMRYAPHKILDDGTECQMCIQIMRKAGVK